MTWTQPICLPCWRLDYPTPGARLNMHKDPTRIKPEYAEMENCCLCGRPTNHGIYVRLDPKTVPYPREDPFGFDACWAEGPGGHCRRPMGHSGVHVYR